MKPFGPNFLPSAETMKKAEGNMTAEQQEASKERLTEVLQMPESLKGWNPSNETLHAALKGEKVDSTIGSALGSIKEDYASMPAQEFELPPMADGIGFDGFAYFKLLPNGYVFMKRLYRDKEPDSDNMYSIMPGEKLVAQIDATLKPKEDEVALLREAKAKISEGAQ